MQLIRISSKNVIHVKREFLVYQVFNVQLQFEWEAMNGHRFVICHMEVMAIAVQLAEILPFNVSTHIQLKGINIVQCVACLLEYKIQCYIIFVELNLCRQSPFSWKKCFIRCNNQYFQSSHLGHSRCNWTSCQFGRTWTWSGRR